MAKSLYWRETLYTTDSNNCSVYQTLIILIVTNLISAKLENTHISEMNNKNINK